MGHHWPGADWPGNDDTDSCDGGAGTNTLAHCE